MSLFLIGVSRTKLYTIDPELQITIIRILICKEIVRYPTIATRTMTVISLSILWTNMTINSASIGVKRRPPRQLNLLLAAHITKQLLDAGL